uniref:Uncharacterized protein n=1 Tax=Eptatretus burgeri TaxID=7764 RepID=A0A8C4PXZ7_EPTBU
MGQSRILAPMCRRPTQNLVSKGMGRDLRARSWKEGLQGMMSAVEDENETKRPHGENCEKPSKEITTSVAEQETLPSMTQERMKRFISRESKLQVVSVLRQDTEREDGKIVKNAVPMNAELKQKGERPVEDSSHTCDDEAKEPEFSPRSLATLIANPPHSTCLIKSTAMGSIQNVPSIDKSIGETNARTVKILGEDNCQQFAPSGRDGNMKSSHDAAPQTKGEHSFAESMVDVIENIHGNIRFDGVQQLGEEPELKRSSDLDQTQDAGAECESIWDEGAQQGNVSPASPVSPVQTRKSRRKVRRVFVIEDDEDSNDGVGKEEGRDTDEAEHSVMTPGTPDAERKGLGGGAEPVAEESAAREHCAFCSQDELSSLGQGELKCFNPTPGFTTLQQHPSHRGSTDSVQSKPTCGPTLSHDGAVSLSAVNELKLVGMHEGTSVLDLIKPDGRCWAHHCCAAWSDGVCLSAELELINVDKALLAASRQRCDHCHRLGASVKCWVEGCRRLYHYPCAPVAGTFQDVRSLSLLCPDHIHQAVAVAGEEANCVMCENPGDLSNQMFCTSCGQHYHSRCLDIVPGTAVRAGWQCPECKICQNCR